MKCSTLRHAPGRVVAGGSNSNTAVVRLGGERGRGVAGLGRRSGKGQQAAADVDGVLACACVNVKPCGESKNDGTYLMHVIPEGAVRLHPRDDLKELTEGLEWRLVSGNENIG